MNFMKTLVAAGLVAASTISAQGADITGAGSTFIYPVLSKWADAYNECTAVAVQQTVDRTPRGAFNRRF